MALASSALSVTASPRSIVLGRDHRVTFTVRGGSGAPLQSAASIGTLEDSGSGVFTWTAPDSGAPRTAIFVFHRDSPSLDVTVVRIPLVGRTDLAVDTEPHARVTVTVAGKDFGPRDADAHGRAKVPIEVPPEAERAEVSAAVAGRIEKRTVPLHVPPDDGLLLAVDRAPLAAEQRRVVVLASAKALAPDRLRLTARGGIVRRLAGSTGWAAFRIRADGKSREIRLRASIRGMPSASAEARISVTPEVAKKSPPAQTTDEVKAAPEAAQSTPTPMLAPVAEVSVALGGRAISGQAPGVALDLEGGFHPDFWDGRIAVDFSLGWIRSGLEAPGGGWDRVQALPLALSIRAELLRAGRFGLSLGAGAGGVAYAVQRFENRAAGRADSGLGWEAFADLGGSWRLGRLQPFISVGAALAPVKSPLVEAKLSGFRARIGIRYAFF